MEIWTSIEIIIGSIFYVLLFLLFFVLLVIYLHYRRKTKPEIFHKTDYFNKVSHDLRTPIHAIEGFATLAKCKIDDPAALAIYLDKISNISSHMLCLVNDVLDVSKLESGHMQIHLQKQDISLLIHQSIDLVQSQMEQRNINFIKEINLEHLDVLVDGIHLVQILTNLLNNAMKYTDSEGIIRLVANETKIEDNRSLYNFEIIDTGCGMSTAFQKKLFEPFAQERAYAHSDVESSGLGLYIVKNLVDKMGGKIQVQSTEQKGSTFLVSLPLEYIKNEQLSFDVLELRGIKLLLAEANPIHQEIIKELAEHIGFILDIASEGQEAYDKYFSSKNWEFACILLDLTLPNWNGFEVTKKIRDSKRLDHSIPIFGMTTDLEGQREKCISLGMTDCFSKPINTRGLLQGIYKALKK